MSERMVTSGGTGRGRAGLLGAAVAVALLAGGCSASFGPQGETGGASGFQPAATDPGPAPIASPDPSYPAAAPDTAATDGPNLDPADPAGAGSTAPAGEPDGEVSEASSAGGKFTPQGARLAIGQKAVVPQLYYGYNGAKDRYGRVGVTVTSITKGSPADVAKMGLGDRAKGMIPYYIRSTVSREDSIKAPVVSPLIATGVLADGSDAQGAVAAASFTKCSTTDAPNFESSDSYERCSIALSPAGSEVVGAEFIGTVKVKGADGLYSVRVKGTDYGREPILWATPRGRSL